jgi:hypothetical protein
MFGPKHPVPAEEPVMIHASPRVARAALLLTLCVVVATSALPALAAQRAVLGELFSASG